MPQLLTKHADVATPWALRYFDLSQFTSIQEYQFPHPKQHPHGSLEDGD